MDKIFIKKGAVVFTAILLILLSGISVSGDPIICGDINKYSQVDIDDVVWLISSIFGGPLPEPICIGDVNNDGDYDIDDAVYLITYIFSGGPAPIDDCCSENPSGTLLGYGDCKMFIEDYTPPDQDCIEYSYDGFGTLLITHVNAGYNCCPELAAEISIENNIITIEEIELSGDCDCLCLFDLEYEIINLLPGIYTISFIEPYLPQGDEPLEFIVDFTTSSSGSHCEYRSQYPWGYL